MSGPCTNTNDCENESSLIVLIIAVPLMDVVHCPAEVISAHLPDTPIVYIYH